jgi:uncharacterized protein
MDPTFLLHFAFYAVTGVVAGLLAGLLGVGGGVIIVPILAYLFELQHIPSDLTMRLALGTSLGTIMFTSISSARAHHQQGAVNWGIVALVSPGILAGTFFGGMLATRLGTPVLKLVFAVFLVAVAMQMLSGVRPRPTRKFPGALGAFGAGLVIGVVSGLVGIGGGSLSVPFMIWCNVEVRRAVGTSAAIGFPIAVAGAFSYMVNGFSTKTGVPYAVGYLHLPALAGVALASVATAPLGARFAGRLEPARLKRAFAYLLLLMSAKMFWGVATPGSHTAVPPKERPQITSTSSAGSQSEQFASAGSPSEELASAGGATNQAGAAGGPSEQIASAASPPKEPVPRGSPSEPVATSGSPPEQAGSAGSP